MPKTSETEETNETTTTTKTHAKVTAKTILGYMTGAALSPEHLSEMRTVIAEMSSEERSQLRQKLAVLGFFKKGSLWNAGLMSDLGDMFRPNIGAQDTVLSISNLALKTTGLVFGGLYAYRGVKSLFVRGADATGMVTATLAAAATLDGAACGG